MQLVKTSGFLSMPIFRFFLFLLNVVTKSFLAGTINEKYGKMSETSGLCQECHYSLRTEFMRMAIISLKEGLLT